MTTQNMKLDTVVSRNEAEQAKPLTRAQQKSWTAMVLGNTAGFMKKNSVNSVIQTSANEDKKQQK
ncbi:MAG: hypothetical protein NT099_00485 [Candidatus Saganbacteria bacterium]|nr:hypothetical protein [Candidatus Saganbacteria bacterium]